MLKYTYNGIEFDYQPNAFKTGDLVDIFSTTDDEMVGFGTVYDTCHNGLGVMVRLGCDMEKRELVGISSEMEYETRYEDEVITFFPHQLSPSFR